jgi:regulation of enolase protein 1 (concanavalin A-like superfamily)
VQIPPQEDEYAIYTKLYSQLPIVILDNYQQLYDQDYLKSKIEYQKNKKYNIELIDFNYWKSYILNLEKTLL